MAWRTALLVALLTLPPPAASAQEAGGAGAEKGAKPDARARFWEARRVMLGGDAATAAELFRTVEAEDPGAPVADDCLYWLGRCYLRVPDREPDAVVAFLRLLREHPESPFVDDAARELARLGDRSAVPILVPRLAKEGRAAELAARGLAELGEEAGVAWLEEREGKRSPPARKAERKAEKKGAGARGPEGELSRLREEIRRLKEQVEEAVALVKKLLAEREKAGGGKRSGEGDDR